MAEEEIPWHERLQRLDRVKARVEAGEMLTQEEIEAWAKEHEIAWRAGKLNPEFEGCDFFTIGLSGMETKNIMTDADAQLRLGRRIDSSIQVENAYKNVPKWLRNLYKPAPKDREPFRVYRDMFRIRGVIPSFLNEGYKPPGYNWTQPSERG